MPDNKADALVEAALTEHRTFHFDGPDGLQPLMSCNWELCRALRDFVEQEPVEAWKCETCFSNQQWDFIFADGVEIEHLRTYTHHNLIPLIPAPTRKP